MEKDIEYYQYHNYGHKAWDCNKNKLVTAHQDEAKGYFYMEDHTKTWQKKTKEQEECKLSLHNDHWHIANEIYKHMTKAKGKSIDLQRENGDNRQSRKQDMLLCA